LCCLSSFAPRLVSQAAQITTLVIQAMVATMARGHIMVEARWWSRSEIDLIIEVPDIGTAERITSGGQDTGAGGTANMSGSAATTSCADTKNPVHEML
jgi:hypothetical protein